MLGLIALVTPTLYKKSAERMQEIQDINIASQARTMNSIIETFIYNQYQQLVSATTEAGHRNALLCFKPDSSGCYSTGYSQFVPMGYKPGDLKTYEAPTVVVHNNGSSLVSYILYPAKTKDSAKTVSLYDGKRASRLASLVGANGGTVVKKDNVKTISGTGGAWELSSSDVNDLDFFPAMNNLVENSLVVTSLEPITLSNMDSEKFLYRVPPTDGDGKNYHNQMVTDLYMGGHEDDTNWSENAKDFYSIKNVRRLTLNTACQAGSSCDGEDVADLYIGAPTGDFSHAPTHGSVGSSNTGAAWIWGNLSALNNRFGLKNTGGSARTGNDVLEFARMADESSVVLSVFKADNGQQTSNSASVQMMGDFVTVSEVGTDQYKFAVGGTANGGNLGSYILASDAESANNSIAAHVLRLNGYFTNSETRINEQGGYVYIGGGNGEDASEVVVNDVAGGVFSVGEGANLIRATGAFASTGSSMVNLLKNTGIFKVGSELEYDNENMMFYGDLEKASMLGGRIVASSGVGEITGVADGSTTVRTQYTTIKGSTHLGTSSMVNANEVNYYRNGWTLGVAGSAWVDDLLAAHRSWIIHGGFQTLHAGYSSYRQFQTDVSSALLNVSSDELKVGQGEEGAFGSSGSMVRMYVASSGNVRIQSGEGAAIDLTQGVAKVGTAHNYMAAENSSAILPNGRIALQGHDRVEIYTEEKGSTGIVSIQDSAMVFSGARTSTNVYTNAIDATAGRFSVKTIGTGTSSASAPQFLVDSSDVNTRYVNFSVYKDDTSSATFRVIPNNSSSTDANVNINGTVHINGNDIIHVASTAENAAGQTGENNAMFEVGPDGVRIWSKENSSAAGYSAPSGDDYYATLEINPYDGGGSSHASGNSGVYIRRGAIELEKSSSGTGDGWAADQGYGFIMANRLVSNVPSSVASIPTNDINGYNAGDAGRYDQYMVNPAYTSVMHDIKLTTRGGARLSDVLPDYVLKGVYNVINNCVENSDYGEVECTETDVNKWADAYVGVIPYASCPPGYKNLATLIPTSFNVGRAGDLVKKSERWVVGLGDRQRAVLSQAGINGDQIAYPNLDEVYQLVYDQVIALESSFTDFSNRVQLREAGRYWGYKTEYDEGGNITKQITSSGAGVWKYGDKYAPVPLYFQQNTWLKASLSPQGGSTSKGWKAFLGFLYDTAEWSGIAGGQASSGTYNRPVNTQHNATDENTEALAGTYVWNLFGVPTNTLEGHATVYCYFNRQQFIDNGWSNLVDDIDQLGALKNTSSSANFRNLNDYGDGSKPVGYKQRLNDPTLKYNDPW